MDKLAQIRKAVADPELNAVAELRTVIEGKAGTTGDPWALDKLAPQIIALCDAYISLRAQCPRGSISVVAGDEFDGMDDDGNPTTFFDAIVGALEFAEVHTYVIELK